MQSLAKNRCNELELEESDGEEFGACPPSADSTGGEKPSGGAEDGKSGGKPAPPAGAGSGTGG